MSESRVVAGYVIVERRPRDVVGHTPCGEEHEFLGIRLSCDKEWGHEDMHGSGPFVEYSLEWPLESAGSTQDAQGEEK